MERRSNSWSYRLCETCLKNSHEAVEMLRQMISVTGVSSEIKEEMWCCPACGSTKKL